MCYIDGQKNKYSLYLECVANCVKNLQCLYNGATNGELLKLYLECVPNFFIYLLLFYSLLKILKEGN
jgi:hypothetical protein